MWGSFTHWSPPGPETLASLAFEAFPWGSFDYLTLRTEWLACPLAEFPEPPQSFSFTPVFLLGESRGRRSLAGYSPRGRKKSDTTEGVHSVWPAKAPPTLRLQGCFAISDPASSRAAICLPGSNYASFVPQVASSASPGQPRGPRPVI